MISYILPVLLMVFHPTLAQYDYEEPQVEEYNPNHFNPLFRRQADAPESMIRVAKRSIKNRYTNPCEVETKLVHLSDGVHTFWPRFYHEVYCRNGVIPSRSHSLLKLVTPPQMCAEHLVCVQRYDEIHILKTRPGSGDECYEIDPKSRQEILVPSGCDCLQPEEVIEFIK